MRVSTHCNLAYSALGFIHFHDQFVVSLVMQVDNDSFLWVVNVAEHALVVLIERHFRMKTCIAFSPMTILYGANPRP